MPVHSEKIGVLADAEAPLPALSQYQTNYEDEKIDFLVQQDPDADEEYTLAEQRKIIHKVDKRLLILLGLMQAVSFLDRANISNAEVAGYEIYCRSTCLTGSDSLQDERGIGTGCWDSLCLFIY
jgi:hypothetical protein